MRSEVARRRARADQQRHRRLPVLDQADAAQDEGAHDDLGDVGLGGEQAPELDAVHAHHPPVRRPSGRRPGSRGR